MGHLMMGHGVSWYFGTRLAPNRADLGFANFRKAKLSQSNALTVELNEAGTVIDLHGAEGGLGKNYRGTPVSTTEFELAICML